MNPMFYLFLWLQRWGSYPAYLRSSLGRAKHWVETVFKGLTVAARLWLYEEMLQLLVQKQLLMSDTMDVLS